MTRIESKPCGSCGELTFSRLRVLADTTCPRGVNWEAPICQLCLASWPYQLQRLRRDLESAQNYAWAVAIGVTVETESAVPPSDWLPHPPRGIWGMDGGATLSSPTTALYLEP